MNDTQRLAKAIYGEDSTQAQEASTVEVAEIVDLKATMEKLMNADESTKAWVMATLLDFRSVNMEQFTRTYGTVANDKIESIIVKG